MPRVVTRILTWAALAAAFAVFVFPLYYLVVTSLKTKAELFQAVPTLYPHDPTIQPYISVLFTRGFLGLLVNSIIVGVSATLIALIVAFAIWYPITRLPVQRGTRNFVHRGFAKAVASEYSDRSLQQRVPRLWCRDPQILLVHHALRLDRIGLSCQWCLDIRETWAASPGISYT